MEGETECQCALPEGMRDCEVFPAEMKVDYIRVYQVPSIESREL